MGVSTNVRLRYRAEGLPLLTVVYEKVGDIMEFKTFFAVRRAVYLAFLAACAIFGRQPEWSISTWLAMMVSIFSRIHHRSDPCQHLVVQIVFYRINKGDLVHQRSGKHYRWSRAGSDTVKDSAGSVNAADPVNIVLDLTACIFCSFTSIASIVSYTLPYRSFQLKMFFTHKKQGAATVER